MKNAMKNVNRIFFILALIAALSSCRKNETTETVTTDDAAEAISSSLSASSGGVSEPVTDAANYLSAEGYGKNEAVSGVYSLSCGVPFDTTITRSHTGLVTAGYTYTCNYLLNCNGINPTSFVYNGSHTGNYNGVKMESTNSGSSSLTFTGLQPLAADFTASGSYSRNGSCTSKVGNHSTFNSSIVVTLSSLTINKTTGKITGGNGAVTAECVTTDGKTANFTGSIVFNGNSTATLTVNGTNYTIVLY